MVEARFRMHAFTQPQPVLLLVPDPASQLRARPNKGMMEVGCAHMDTVIWVIDLFGLPCAMRLWV
jgi:hypothetical protein